MFAPSRVMCDVLNGLGVMNTAHQPLGVDADVFQPQRRGNWLRQRLGIAANARVLAYAGRFSGEKNLPVLFEAFAQIGLAVSLAADRR